MDLATVPQRTQARVISVGMDSATCLRLRELGLCVGAMVHVTHNGAFGGRVIGLGADRIALDARTARAIMVDVA